MYGYIFRNSTHFVYSGTPLNGAHFVFKWFGNTVFPFEQDKRWSEFKTEGKKPPETQLCAMEASLTLIVYGTVCIALQILVSM